MELISIYDKNSDAFIRLLAAARLLQLETGKHAKVETVYFDYGANIQWTTLLLEYDTGRYMQVLSPRDQELLIGNFEDWYKVMRKLIAKYGKD